DVHAIAATSMLSLDSTSSSIATSPPPLAASVGPVYFDGTTPPSVHFCTGVPPSSRRVITTVRLAATLCTCVCVIQSHRSVELTMPRLSVTSPTLCTPGTLRTWLGRSLPLRYSAMVISD